MSIYSRPWRIAGWIGGVVFEAVVMALTAFRAIRLRMSGHRISIVESMLQDGIYYFGEHTINNPSHNQPISSRSSRLWA